MDGDSRQSTSVPRKALWRRLIPRFRVRTLLVLIAFVALAIGGYQAWDWRNRLGEAADVLEMGAQQNMKTAEQQDELEQQPMDFASQARQLPSRPDIKPTSRDRVRKDSEAYAQECEEQAARGISIGPRHRERLLASKSDSLAVSDAPGIDPGNYLDRVSYPNSRNMTDSQGRP